MPSDAIAAFVTAVGEVDDLESADPTPLGGAPVDPTTSRVIGRASVVLLSSHFERYIYAVNQEATAVLNQANASGTRLPEPLRLLHSRLGIETMLETGWERRAPQLRAFMATDGWLWTDDNDNRPGLIEHDRLLIWMKAPTPKNLIRYYRYWEIDDIFAAITRVIHTRTDLRLKLDELVRKRNNIAHGDATTEATRSDVRGYRDGTLRFCERADRQLAKALAKLSGTRPW